MKEQIKRYSTESGVYLMKDKEGRVLYVGKAKNLRQRLQQYFAGSDQRAMVPLLTAQVVHIDTLVVPSEKEALLLENTLIKKHKPKYNALLKDDKTFISLMVNHLHRWPMIRLVRSKTGKSKEKGLFFGPYTSAYAARQTFELLTRLFPLRQCSDEELKRRTRPCLLYGIKKCIAPCVNLCTKEEYDTFVQGAIAFLKGENKEVLDNLRREMEKASEKLEFEKADAFLKTIRQIEHVTSHKKLVVKTGKECDVLGLYRRGHFLLIMQLFFREGNLVGSEHYPFADVASDDKELMDSFLMQHYQHKHKETKEILLPFALENQKALQEILGIPLTVPEKGDKKALVTLAQKNAEVTFEQEMHQQDLKEQMLLDLQETLKLNRYPKRIECFDTSMLSGTDLVASLVAFTNGEKDSKRYRLYRIKGIQKGDDYGALRQALSRRLVRAKEEGDLPDLIIVDGGKGQLNIVLELFKELDIATVDAIGVAKDEGRHTRGITQEQIFLPHHKDPLLLPAHSPLLFLLQKVRDEAHRRALQFHRTRRTKRTLESSLDTIPGIGAIKKQRLLRHFGSLKRIKEASPEELKKIKGLTAKDIQNIKKGTMRIMGDIISPLDEVWDADR